VTVKSYRKFKSEKANFIWIVADDILGGAFKAHEYGDVILSFEVIKHRHFLGFFGAPDFSLFGGKISSTRCSTD